MQTKNALVTGTLRVLGKVYTEQAEIGTITLNTINSSSIITTSLTVSDEIQGTAKYANNLNGFKTYAKTGTDPNNVTTNGIYYATNTSSIDSIAYGALFAQVYDSNWICEIYQKYETGALSVRGKTSSSGWTSWKKVLDSSNYADYTVKQDGTGASGTWGISISGASNSAVKDSKDQTIISTYIKSLSVSGKVITYTKGDGTTGTITTQDTNTTYPLTERTIDANFSTKYRTETFGTTNNGWYVSALRCDTASVANCPKYGSGLGWGKGDTHGYLYLSYSSDDAYMGGGNANKLNWVRKIAFTTSTVSAAKVLETARTISLTGSVTGSVSFDGSGDVSLATTTNHSHDDLYLRKNANAVGANALVDSYTSIQASLNSVGTSVDKNSMKITYSDPSTTTTGCPSALAGFVLSMRDSGYQYAQLYLDTRVTIGNTPGMYIRSGDSVGWTNWGTVVTSYNISSFAISSLKGGTLHNSLYFDTSDCPTELISTVDNASSFRYETLTETDPSDNNSKIILSHKFYNYVNPDVDYIRYAWEYSGLNIMKANYDRKSANTSFIFPTGSTVTIGNTTVNESYLATVNSLIPTFKTINLVSGIDGTAYIYTFGKIAIITFNTSHTYSSGSTKIIDNDSITGFNYNETVYGTCEYTSATISTGTVKVTVKASSGIMGGLLVYISISGARTVSNCYGSVTMIIK